MTIRVYDSLSSGLFLQRKNSFREELGVPAKLLTKSLQQTRLPIFLAACVLDKHFWEVKNQLRSVTTQHHDTAAFLTA